MYLLAVSGPEFLLVYVLLLGGSIFLALWVRRSYRVPDENPGIELRKLHPYEVAYLEGRSSQAARRRPRLSGATRCGEG